MRDRQFLLLGIIQLIAFAFLVMVTLRSEVILGELEQLSFHFKIISSNTEKHNDLLQAMMEHNLLLESKLKQLEESLNNKISPHALEQPPVDPSPQIEEEKPLIIFPSVFGFCNRSLDEPDIEAAPVFQVLNIYKPVERPTNSTCYEITQIRSRYHLCMLHPEEDLISASIRTDGIWEASKSHLFSILFKDEMKKSNPRKVVLDIGANQGYYGLNAAAFGFKVVMVEPGPVLVDLLRQSILRNGFENLVTVLQNAVNNVRQVMAFSFMDNNSGSSYLMRLADDKTSSVHVHSVLVDDIVEFLQIDPTQIFLIKIDVEGYEYHAYDGMVKVITEGRPYIMTMEIGNTDYCDVNKVMDKMYELGYIMVEDFKPSTVNTLQQAKERVKNGLIEALFIRADMHQSMVGHITVDPWWFDRLDG